ncbi:MAG: GNAT family N-acetyltransferase [Candidatus Dadabacteria bacterium]|nr:MAG: GNAT family N-acetyltransferase [Candidatus Dadabacteria bacterium]
MWRESIKASCFPIYKNLVKEEILKKWANKTEKDVEKLVGNSKTFAAISKQGEIVGFASYITHQKEKGIEGEIKCLYVAPKAFRKGVGSFLLENIEQKIVEEGAEKIFLYSSINAINFYRKANYKITREKLLLFNEIISWKMLKK